MIINLLYNIEFYYFFYGKFIFEAIFAILDPRKWRKNEAEMPKQVPQNAVLVKKHNDRQEMDIEHGFSLNLRDRSI